MKLGEIFGAIEAGSCGKCGKGYMAGADVRWVDDEYIVHRGCVDEEESESGVVAVVRGHDGRPYAVPAEIVTKYERPFRAYQLHSAGHSWEMIALQENYPSWRAAAADVKRYIDEGAAAYSVFKKRELITIELARYDRYQSYLEPAAQKGSVPAINTALAISSMRVKLTHMDAAFIGDDDDEGAGQGEGRTVVVGSGNDEDSFTEQMRAAADERGHR